MSEPMGSLMLENKVETVFSQIYLFSNRHYYENIVFFPFEFIFPLSTVRLRQPRHDNREINKWAKATINIIILNKNILNLNHHNVQHGARRSNMKIKISTRKLNIQERKYRKG